MNKYFHGVMLGLLASGMATDSWSENPIFLVTPNFVSSSPLVQGQLGTATFQVINNSKRTLSNISLKNLPNGVTQVANAGPDYCSSTTALTTPGSLCLIQLQINTSISGNVSGGPVICSDNGARCSKPYSTDQLSLQITPGSVSQACIPNTANFSYELSQVFDSSVIDSSTIYSWGPARNVLALSSSNPNLTVCTTTDPTNSTAIQWMQNRVIAAEEFWVAQKLNYCHHHVPDFYTPYVSYGTQRTQIPGTGSDEGGYCNPATNLMPGPTYGQQIRWNYSGTGSETADIWTNKNRMWYGMDCSDFTSFIYNFAFGIQMDSDTGYQAGQASDGSHSQDYVTPNSQGTGTASLLGLPVDDDPNSPAGLLVCKDGTVETRSGPDAYCGGLGTNGYFSVFRGPYVAPTPYPAPHPEDITAEMLTKLQPGDLIFLGFAGSDGNNPTSMVTHVITWTGLKIGTGPGQIPPSQIAPESVCPMSDWAPVDGEWVIIDSHYQGADYRAFTPCFYQNNIWGVRRVVGYMSSGTI